MTTIPLEEIAKRMAEHNGPYMRTHESVASVVGRLMSSIQIAISEPRTSLGGNDPVPLRIELWLAFVDLMRIRHECGGPWYLEDRVRMRYRDQEPPYDRPEVLIAPIMLKLAHAIRYDERGNRDDAVMVLGFAILEMFHLADRIGVDLYEVVFPEVAR